MQASIGAAYKDAFGSIKQQCSVVGNRQFTSSSNSQTMAGHYYNAIYANMDIGTNLLEGRMKVTSMEPGSSGIKFRMDDGDPDRYRMGYLVIGN